MKPAVRISCMTLYGSPDTQSINNILFNQRMVRMYLDQQIFDLMEEVKIKQPCDRPVELIQVFKPHTPKDLTPTICRDDLQNQPLREYADELVMKVYIHQLLGVNARCTTPPTPPDLIVVMTPPRTAAHHDAQDDGDEEARDIVTDLEYKHDRFVEMILGGAAPSEASKSQTYNEVQATNNHALVDGRWSAKKFTDVVGIPVELFHRVFAQFLKDANDAELDVPEQIVRDTAKLMRSCSQIQVREAPRDIDVSSKLREILDCTLEKISNTDSISADYVSTQMTRGNVYAATGLVEVNGELANGAEASVQLSFSCARWYCLPERDPIRKESCCPTFLVGLPGPWLIILGAVTTSSLIVQRLTPYEWLAVSCAMDDAQVQRISRRLYALRRGMKTLETYYTEFKEPEVPAGYIHPRHWPSITSYVSETGQTVTFQYVKPLEHGHSCATFLAQRQGMPEDRVVIKFVRRYNEKAHRAMADKGFAPTLIHYGSLGEPYSHDLHVVVMEHVVGQTLHQRYPVGALPHDVKQALRTALDILTEEGYIFPDLQRPNVMLLSGEDSVEKRLRLIDFDWVCRKDSGARYPCHLSPELRTRSEAQDYDVIMQHHQENMFQKL